MGQLQRTRSVGGSHVLPLLFMMMLSLNSLSFAQQAWRVPGYFCSDTGKKTCSSFALYRAQAAYGDITTIAKLFGVRATRVAKLSNLSVNQTLTTGEPVIIPLATCGCYNGTSYSNVTYTIVANDTFYDVNLNNFESLASSTAVINANSELNYRDLSIGQKIVYPVFCSCPSTLQVAKGVTALVTYPVVKGDAVGAIGTSFGVQTADIISANKLVGANTEIYAEQTLLIPINTSQPTFNSPIVPLPSPGSSSSPTPAPVSPAAPSGHHSSNKTGLYVAIAAGVCVAILVLAAAATCMVVTLRKRRDRVSSGGKDDTESPLVLRGAGIGGSPMASVPSPASNANVKAPGDPLAGMSDLVGSDRPALFTYAELSDATNNFSDASKLQGSVYRGVLNGQVVAIKQMKGNVSQELRILCRVHHTNLVKLVGLCVKEAEHLYLVYEYAENGSLSDCLHTDYLARHKLSTKSSSYLSWIMRVQVALDAASGLEYIHDYVTPSYVHKDVKSSNILLDSTFRAKIANFAMAKSGGGSNDMMTRHIAGTYGYMAPEYLAHGLVTTKADVFAFGVVLLELLSGNEAISEDSDGEERCLYSAIRPVLESADPAASLKKWMDPVLESNYPMDTALSVASLAKSCVDMDPNSRPSMKDISFALSKQLNASLEWETSSVFANTLAGTPIEAR